MKENTLPSYFFPEEEDQNLGIYLHFPWCLQKCHYCDFYSIGLDGSKQMGNVPAELLQHYLKTLVQELDQRLSDSSSFRSSGKINSIYFGGGTPSLLPIETLSMFLERLGQKFDLMTDCEVSLEGNPENMTPDYLASLYAIGINRINVGLQSFQPKVLKAMNRFYSKERYTAILHDLKTSPFINFGLDLIYGFPGQTEDDFYADLQKTLFAQPTHLSLYSLTAEPNTVYGQTVQNNSATAPDEDLQGQVWEHLPLLTQKAGMQHYEVSNFALPGYWCRHNLRYWLYEPYMGLGPGAHGFDGSHRYANPRSLKQWLKEPGGALYTDREPHVEVPLMFLRLCAPWPLTLGKRVLLEKAGLKPEAWEQFEECLNTWVQKGLGRFCRQNGQECFQWKQEGLSFLNDRVYEMHSALVDRQALSFC